MEAATDLAAGPLTPASDDNAKDDITPIAPVSWATRVGPKLGRPRPALDGACRFAALSNADFSAARLVSTELALAVGLVAYTCAATSASSTFTRSIGRALGLSTAWKYSAWYNDAATTLALMVTVPD